MQQLRQNQFPRRNPPRASREQKPVKNLRCDYLDSVALFFNRIGFFRAATTLNAHMFCSHQRPYRGDGQGAPGTGSRLILRFHVQRARFQSGNATIPLAATDWVKRARIPSLSLFFFKTGSNFLCQSIHLASKVVHGFMATDG